ncbi:MAG: SatD family protein [Microbacterium sp.]
MSVAVIADIVGSRSLPDRAAAQRALDDTIESVERDLPLAERPLQSTVGDELQGVYPSLADAMASLLLLRLALPEAVECRYGLGLGEIGEIPSRSGALAEGPGWWAARKAIEAVHAKQSRTIPGARTWVEADVTAELSDRAVVSLANAYLLSRDQLVSAMSPRARRLAYGRLLGQTQRELAHAEGITQSAVSQALAAAGVGALAEGFAQLRGGA